ncbi:tyrosine-protein phosphatase [Amycolatopsis sp. NPDC049868]|uniref:tyrosine-protein phosphatase n=1 Tax=Amycolatopsis sp. NPDC049868 TaxID=3363934 RepID=UPI003792548A
MTWEGFYNTRDLGGLPTRSGQTTRHGAFFRAADLRFVTDEGWSQARQAGVRTIVDLRNADEIRPATAKSPTALAGSAQFTAATAGVTTPTGVDRIEVPLDDIEDIEFWQHINSEQLNGSPLYYRPFLERKPGRCAAVRCRIPLWTVRRGRGRAFGPRSDRGGSFALSARRLLPDVMKGSFRTFFVLNDPFMTLE